VGNGPGKGEKRVEKIKGGGGGGKKVGYPKSGVRGKGITFRFAGFFIKSESAQSPEIATREGGKG